jgi:hypothetical protein
MDALDLFRFLRSNFAKFNMQYHAFGSEAIMLDIITMNGTYVIEWSPRNSDQIGISNAVNATFGFEGFEEILPSFEAAQAHLSDILSRTTPPEEIYGDPKYT